MRQDLRTGSYSSYCRQDQQCLLANVLCTKLAKCMACSAQELLAAAQADAAMSSPGGLVQTIELGSVDVCSE